MKKALEAFYIHEKGILNIIRAADIYAICLLAKIRAVDPDIEQIAGILEGNKITGYNLMSIYYTDHELVQLKQKGHFKEIGEQIILQTYTMLESYLKSKFYEYNYFINGNLKKFHFRDLKEFKAKYKEVLDIHLPSFDFDYFFPDGKCSFQPKGSWETIKILAKARNEIAHEGTSNSYTVTTLMDSWYPFDFTRRWIVSFDANFNSFIYDKFETSLIKEYKLRKKV